MSALSWLDRLIGLNSMAPPAGDSKPDATEQDDDKASFLFDILAPRKENTSTGEGIHSPHTSSPPDNDKTTHNEYVDCVHCHKQTPIATTAVEPSSSDQYKTPSRHGDNASLLAMLPPTPGTVLQVTDVNQIHALKTKEMARAGLEMQMMASKSDGFKEKLQKIFRMIVRKTVPSDAEIEHLNSTIEKDLDDCTARPDDLLLLFGRTSRQFFGASVIGDVPDGFTPLLLCAMSNQTKIAKTLLKYKKQEQLDRCTCAGQTAIHVAAFYGSKAMYDLLAPLYPKFVPDASGMSAFTISVTSPRNKNKGKFREVYSPEDPSVMQSPGRRPFTDKVKRILARLGAVAGLVSIAGQRGYNEDAETCSAWEERETPMFFACVCDGHTDAGEVSHFVAKNLPHAIAQLSEAATWQERMENACNLVDEELKKMQIGGGSTAVFFVLTANEIVVGNVGDSRCILIQRSESTDDSTPTDITEGMTKLSLDADTYSVVPLSKDHNIEGEELKRLQDAGASLTEATYTNTFGKEVKKYKFSKHGLAMSRAFGDFECKEFGLTCLPDVLVRGRSPRDAFLVLACDGVWDAHTNEDVAKMVMEELSTATEITAEVLDEAAQRIAAKSLDSQDNISLIIVALDRVKRHDPSMDLLPSLTSPGMMSPQRNETTRGN
jgi:serine/threonine protein phosphatase PrpC